MTADDFKALADAFVREVMRGDRVVLLEKYTITSAYGDMVQFGVKVRFYKDEAVQPDKVVEG